MLWRFLFRPLVAMVCGALGVTVAEESPAAACVVGLIALALFVGLVLDILRLFNEVFHAW